MMFPKFVVLIGVLAFMAGAQGKALRNGYEEKKSSTVLDSVRSLLSAGTLAAQSMPRPNPAAKVAGVMGVEEDAEERHPVTKTGSAKKVDKLEAAVQVLTKELDDTEKQLAQVEIDIETTKAAYAAVKQEKKTYKYGDLEKKERSATKKEFLAELKALKADIKLLTKTATKDKKIIKKDEKKIDKFSTKAENIMENAEKKAEKDAKKADDQRRGLVTLLPPVAPAAAVMTTTAVETETTTAMQSSKSEDEDEEEDKHPILKYDKVDTLKAAVKELQDEVDYTEKHMETIERSLEKAKVAYSKVKEEKKSFNYDSLKKDQRSDAKKEFLAQMKEIEEEIASLEEDYEADKDVVKTDTKLIEKKDKQAEKLVSKTEKMETKKETLKAKSSGKDRRLKSSSSKEDAMTVAGWDDTPGSSHDDDAEIVALKAAVGQYTKEITKAASNLESVEEDIDETKGSISTTKEQLEELEDTLDDLKKYEATLEKDEAKDEKTIKKDAKKIKSALKKIRKLDKKWEKSQKDRRLKSSSKEDSMTVAGYDDTPGSSHDDDAEIVGLKAAVKVYTKDMEKAASNLESVEEDLASTKEAISTTKEQIAEVEDTLDEEKSYEATLEKDEAKDEKIISKDTKKIKSTLKKIRKLDKKWEKSQK